MLFPCQQVYLLLYVSVMSAGPSGMKSFLVTSSAHLLVAYGDRRIKQLSCFPLPKLWLNTSIYCWTFLIPPFFSICTSFLIHNCILWYVCLSVFASVVFSFHPFADLARPAEENEDDHLPPGWTNSPRGLLPLHLWHLLHLSPGPWHDTPRHPPGTAFVQTGVSGGRWSSSWQFLHAPPEWLVQGPVPKVWKLEQWALSLPCNN